MDEVRYFTCACQSCGGHSRDQFVEVVYMVLVEGRGLPLPAGHSLYRQTTVRLGLGVGLLDDGAEELVNNRDGLFALFPVAHNQLHGLALHQVFRVEL